jgi:4-amino-4-deoxy-L-arabinose transferase-like glycosyltransferase
MLRKSRPLFVAGALLALYWWMATSVSRRHCPAADEIAHLTAGYAYWTTGDLRFQPENGNLPQRWAALPLLAQRPNFPAPEGDAWRQADVWRIGFAFFYTLGNDLARMLQTGRAVMALFGVAVGAMVFAWARSLFGRAGAFVSLTLCVFCPNLLAHGGLITSDMAATAGFLAAMLAWWRLAHRITAGRVVLAGAALGALALAKFSAVMFLPMLAVMLVVRLARRAPLPVQLGAAPRSVRGWRQAAVLCAAGGAAALIAIGLLWAAYDFRFVATPATDRDGASFNVSWDEVLLTEATPPGAPPAGQARLYNVNPGNLRTGWAQAVIRSARDHRLLPEPYLYGLAYVLRFAGWRPAFLNGETRTTGWWQFFPVAFALKTPLPVFGLLALAAGGIGLQTRRGNHHRDHRRSRTRLLYRLSPLLILPGVYWAFAVTSHLDIGLRHLLPTYPPLYVLAGAAGWFFQRQSRWTAVLVAALLGWLGAASWWIRPDYLAYFNPLAGGPIRGYRHLVDSSLDWGQDLPGLHDWLARHTQPGERVFLSYFGSGDPLYYGIHATRVGDDFFDLRERPALPDMQGGLYCLSATMFQHIYTQVRGPWSDAYEQDYQRLTRWFTPFAQNPDLANARDLDGTLLTRAQVLARLFALEQLRFGRLCHCLRDRTPEAEVGYSILIFRLTGDDIHRALAGPP